MLLKLDENGNVPTPEPPTGYTLWMLFLAALLVALAGYFAYEAGWLPKP